MNVIIPMSGTGQRFVEAGYQTLKPLIEVEGKPIIEHVVDRFDPQDRFIFICNEEHLKTTQVQNVLKGLKPEAEIFPVAPHKKGPVHAVMMAENLIPDDEPCIVNYCDFSWRWNYDDFRKTVEENQCDGCVVCYKGFHPHLLTENLYASVLDDGRNWALDIKEKFSFTEDKMESFQSSGTYYFRRGDILKYAGKKQIERDIHINGEYYASLLYDILLKDKRSVYIYEVPFFLQWGTPEDLEEYVYWSEIFHAGK